MQENREQFYEPLFALPITSIKINMRIYVKIFEQTGEKGKIFERLKNVKIVQQRNGPHSTLGFVPGSKSFLDST